jgi:hypothetical protein
MPEPSIAEAALNGATSAAADYAQTATGVVLMTTPFWVSLLTTINIVAATIASVCGAAVGLIGVWRILHRPRGQP